MTTTRGQPSSNWLQPLINVEGDKYMVATWLWLSEAMGSHFGVGECTTHFRTYFSGDWDVHWGATGVLTHVHISKVVSPQPELPRISRTTSWMTHGARKGNLTLRFGCPEPPEKKKYKKDNKKETKNSNNNKKAKQKRDASTLATAGGPLFERGSFVEAF